MREWIIVTIMGQEDSRLREIVFSCTTPRPTVLWIQGGFIMNYNDFNRLDGNAEFNRLTSRSGFGFRISSDQQLDRSICTIIEAIKQ